MKEKVPFMEYHLLQMFNDYNDALPLDRYLYHYFKNHKALGSKDRAFVANTAYGMMRWLGLIDHLNAGNNSWEERLKTFLTLPSSVDSLPPHVQVSFPKNLYKLLEQDYSEEEAKKICLASNEQAPTTIRVNSLKISREAFIDALSGRYEISPGEHSPEAVVFSKRIPLFSLPEFEKGQFEMQDEGSQLLANLVKLQAGEQFLDYCAGSGGKTLAIAPRLQGRGQIYLHDIRERALQEAKKRLKRAGIENAQILLPDSPNREKLKKKCDWVLADVPCSGTGTLRRNPDMKWRFSEEGLEELLGKQRAIFEKALSFVKPGGMIVYATCSLLKKENEEQIEHFLKTYPVELVGSPLKIVPDERGMDGFFGATLCKK